MGLSRRFLNLIVHNLINPATKSLRRVDLTHHKLLNTTVPALPPLNGNTSESQGPPATTTLWGGNPKNKNKKTGTIRLPAPSIHLRASATDFEWYMDCFPLAGSSKLLCGDQSDRTVLFDVDTRQAELVPHLQWPKSLPLTIFVPGAGDVNDDGGGSVYIMESCPNPEPGDAMQLSSQFQAFVYRRPSTSTSFTKSGSWQRELLPPPPFICNPKHYVPTGKRLMITSYAVVGSGGSQQVCVSADRAAGTYCLDTATHTWTQVGEWTLPFVGKVEYVPELKLWFGICAKDFQLGAVDLSAMDMDMDSQAPELVGTWKELEAPQGWTEMLHPQLGNLGSGRFCVARFFHALNPLARLFHALNPMAFESDEPGEEYFFTVLTGADVVPCVHDGNSGSANAACSNAVNGSNGKVELKMIRHNSRRRMSYGSDGTIRLVF
ncbi:hypothetical protein BAE44_0004058 [Dichanthelium oligosanthes]|uniref:Uncharacterized protein n=1 Tax=Dichanthelium oligosanthes TaxID=888268 RepID=A0A1E5WBW6_9POAL|nr:hypothetical protein BAE44_0004058 [Dichanthelium oligosanthes]